MNSSPNFADWSREKKDEYAESRMLEMKQKNAKLMQRYAEVEQDRLKAEEHNSAVTKVLPKKDKATNIYEPKTESRSEHAREWDRGKPDKEHWRSPDHHAAAFKNYRTSRFEKGPDRKDHWHSFSRNENTDQYQYERGPDSARNRKTKGNYNYKQRDSDQFQVSTSSHLHMSPKRSRGMGQRNSDPQRKSQSSYSDEKFRKNEYNRSNSKKKYPYRAQSRSTSVSDSDCIDNITNMQLSLRASSLWENDKTTEDQNKQNRVERWVKSVNKSNNWPEKQITVAKNSGKTYSKFDRFERASSHSSEDDKHDTNLNTSLRENKSPGSNKYFSPQSADFYENKFGNRRQSTPMKTYPIAGKQKAKRSPQYSSPGSGKNENFRKQRRFDSRGFKNYDTKDKYNKSKPFNPTIRNLNAQYSPCVSYDRHEDDTWGSVTKAEYHPDDDEGIWAHIDQESTDHNKKKCGNKVQDDDGIWGHIDQESADRKKEQYDSKVEGDDGIWSSGNQEGTYRSRKQYIRVDADEIWGDYQQDISKLGFKKRTEEDDEGILSNVIQDSCKTDKEKVCEEVSEECASDQEKISVDYKKQSTHQDADSNLCNVEQTSFAHNTEQNVPADEDKVINKQVDQADDGWEDVEQSGSKWKLSEEETDPQSSENQNQEGEGKQTSENKNVAENDSLYDNEANSNKLMEHQDPVKLSNDSDNVNAAEDVPVLILQNTSVDDDLNESLKKLTPDDDNITKPTEESVSPSKRTVCISDERNISDGVSLSEKNQNESDDGGWSTVSEGEVRSDDNGNEIEHCKTKTISAHCDKIFP